MRGVGGGSNADTRLVNAWGIAFNPQGSVWGANNATSTSTLYDGAGVPQTLVVPIPSRAAGSGRPTGLALSSAGGAPRLYGVYGRIDFR